MRPKRSVDPIAALGADLVTVPGSPGQSSPAGVGEWLAIVLVAGFLGGDLPAGARSGARPTIRPDEAIGRGTFWSAMLIVGGLPGEPQHF